MANGKKFYWIKIKDSFMTSDKVDYIMSQPNGASYIVIYQMLCLKCINTDGELVRHIGEVIIPFDTQKITRDLKYFDIDVVEKALQIFMALGMIYQEDDGYLKIAEFENMVGSETDWAERKRIQRMKIGDNVLEDNGQTMDTLSGQCPSDIRERDKEIDKDIDINSCTEQSSEPEADVSAIILNDGSEWKPTASQYAEYIQLYPNADVKAEFAKMRGWCIGNPKKRKTKSGVQRFVNAWLSKAQNENHNFSYSQKQTTVNKKADLSEWEKYVVR